MCAPQMKRYPEAAGSLETDGQKILCFLPVPGELFCVHRTRWQCCFGRNVCVTENAGLSPNVSYSNAYINEINSKTYGNAWVL